MVLAQLHKNYTINMVFKMKFNSEFFSRVTITSKKGHFWNESLGKLSDFEIFHSEKATPRKIGHFEIDKFENESLRIFL